MQKFLCMLLPYCLLAPLRLKKHPQKKCMCLVGVWKPRASRTSEWRRMRAGKSKIGIKGPPGFMGLKCAWERKIREIRQRERERAIPNENWQSCLVADSYTVPFNPKLLRFWPGASRALSLSLSYLLTH